MKIFNTDVKEVSIDWPTLKYDNHGGGQAMLLTRDMKLIAYVSWLTRPDKSRKHR